MNLSKAFVTVVSGILFLVFLSFVLSWPVYMLWNVCLVGAVDGVHEVSWLQAWGISVLCGFLFRTTASTK
jgi:sterol desaturase/sphingolipid hydroxylase (fatty acid hydroxylase superfamily)